MKRPIIIAVSMLFVLGGLAGLVPSTVAQSDEVAVTDPAGDVAFYAGNKYLDRRDQPPTAAPVTVPGEVTGPVDLTGFKVLGETATTISFELSVASFDRPNTWQPGAVDYSLCFQWSGTGGMYRFIFNAAFAPNPQAEANSRPIFQGGELARIQECLPYEDSTGSASDNELKAVQSFQFHTEYNLDENVVRWTIPRKYFSLLNPENAPDAPVLDPLPKAGDTFTGLQAYAVSWAATSSYVTYDETGPSDFTLKLNTGNELVKVMVPANIRAGGTIGGFDTPIYGVEIGSFQTIPVTVENHLDTPIEPNITVSILSGEASKWDLRTLPSIPVPKKVGETPGRATVTLIVNSDPTIAHKESVRLLVSALDQNHPEQLGAQTVDIVGVEPPRTGSSTVYLHGNGDRCSAYGRWINTLQSDASATASELPFIECNVEGDGATAGTIGFMFTPDVPFARDYTLSTSETAKATIVLRSLYRIPGDASQEIDFPTTADVTVQVMAGTSVVGEYTQKGVSLDAQKTPVDIPVPIQGEILGGLGRMVPNDKGIGIRVEVTPVARTFEMGGCVQGQCTPQSDVDVQQGGGRIYLVLDESKVVLPIATSERSGDIINITKSGALISLRQSDPDAEKRVFVNPGGTKVFNLTVRNEGVNVDTAKISARLNQTGWQAEILPTTSYKLKVGQPRSFNIRLTAPEGAGEGLTLLMEVQATSAVDPNAVAKLPLTIEVTTGQKFDDEFIDDKLQEVDETEESPGLPLSVLLLSMIGLFAVSRRRRL